MLGAGYPFPGFGEDERDHGSCVIVCTCLPAGGDLVDLKVYFQLKIRFGGW